MKTEFRAGTAFLLVLLASTFALLWGRTFPAGGLGAYLLTLAVCMVALWPSTLPPLGASLLALAGAFCAFLALLPMEWLPVPAWRGGWAAAAAIPLVSSVSLDPAATTFWAGLLVASCFGAIFLAGHGLDRAGLSVVAMGIVSIVAIMAVAAIWSRETGWKPAFHGGASFGFLPNRNHTGTLLATGAIVGIGLAYHHFRLAENIRGFVAAALVVPPLLGLYIYSESRAGALLPVLALVVWVAGIGPRKFSVAAWTTAAAVTAVAAFVFLTQANPVKERLAVLADSIGSEGPVDFRQRVFADALELGAAYPLTGVGIGMFEPAFANYRKASLIDSICLHPESDWLMFVGEAGWPAALCLLGAFVLALRHVFRGRESRAWPLRWALASAWAAAVFHAFVDVPWHRVPLGWFLLVCGMAAVAVPGMRLTGVRLVLVRCVWVALGVALGVAGWGLVRAQWMGGEMPAPLRWETLRWEITRALEEKRNGDGSALAGEAIAANPGNSDAYYLKAAFELTFEGTDAFADDLLQASALLEPRMPLTAIQHGRLWLGIDSARSARLYAEAIRRGAAIDATGIQPGRQAALGALDVALRDAAPVPAVQEAIVGNLDGNPSLLAAWFVRVKPDMALSWWDGVEGKDAFVQQLPDAGGMLARLAELGRTDEAFGLVARHRLQTGQPGLHWRVVAASRAREKNFEAALNEALAHSGESFPNQWMQNPEEATTPFQRQVSVLLRDRNQVAANRMATEILSDKEARETDLAACVEFFRATGSFEKAWQAFCRLPVWLKRGR